jgi:hypothetical protein
MTKRQPRRYGFASLLIAATSLMFCALSPAQPAKTDTNSALSIPKDEYQRRMDALNARAAAQRAWADWPNNPQSRGVPVERAQRIWEEELSRFQESGLSGDALQVAANTAFWDRIIDLGLSGAAKTGLIENAPPERVQRVFRTAFPDQHFERVTLIDMLSLYHDLTNIPIVVSWPALQKGGVTRDKPVTITLKDVTLAEALSALLDSVSNEEARIAYDEVGGVIYISTKDALGVNAKGHDVATRPSAPHGPSYLVAPLHGVVGLYVTDELLRGYLGIARREKPSVVILDIDSPGGDVAEMEKMLNTIVSSQNDVNLVAFVHDAYSAAAIIAISCPLIVIVPGGSIGGAVPYQIGPNGTPKNIEAKFQSIYRAKIRSAVVAAGHEPLLAEAMIRADLVLSRIGEGASCKIIEGRPRSSTGIKNSGEILTFSSDEAVLNGLAVGLAKSVSAAGPVLGFKSGWAERSQSGEDLFDDYKDAVDSAARTYAVAIEDARKSYAQATAIEPSQFTYLVNSQTGKFTAASLREWQQRSDSCSALVQQAQRSLTNARDIIERFPNIVAHPDAKDSALDLSEIDAFSRTAAHLGDMVRADRQNPGISK